MHSAAALSVKPHRACAACGADDAVVCHHQKFVVPDGYPLPSAYDVLICRRCGFSYADPAATQQDYDYFYRNWTKYDDGVTATGGGSSFYDSAQLAATASDIARTIASKAATILDAGCATGGLLTALRTEGFTAVAGLDPSPRCADACRQRGFRSYVGSITSVPPDMPKFDCIVLSHVLEHVFDVPAFFAAVQRLLVPGGHVYLETPDASRYADHFSAPFQEFSTEHINHFSARALKNMARRFGFSSVLVEPKLLRTSADTYYPAVFGVFRDLGIAARYADVIADPDLPGKIEAYVRNSAAMMDEIHRHLTNQLQDHKQVILWGAGQLALKLLALPCLEKAEIRAIVDSNPVLRGRTLRGAPIVAPSAIMSTSEPVVITSLLHGNDITAQIRRMGWSNPVLTLLPAPNRTEVARL